MVSNPYLPIPVTIRKIITETAAKDIKTFELAFCDEGDAARFDYVCGQFAEISVLGVGECPIGIASSPMDRGVLQFTIKRAGVVTTALHLSQEGRRIGVRGPYGNGFPMDLLEGADQGVRRNIVVIGGGFAFTTLRSLTWYILHEENRSRFGDLTVIYGARSPGDLIYQYDLAAWEKREDIHLFVTVDKGDETWTGREGFVPTITQEVAPSSENAYAIVCGPPVMIRFTLPVLTHLGFTPETIINSLEMRMKCGLGKCGRCNIGSKFVCKDGPVFTYKELMGMPQEY